MARAKKAASAEVDPTVKLRRLEKKLQAIEREYDLGSVVIRQAKVNIRLFGILVFCVMVISIVFSALFTTQVLTGIHLVAITALIVIGVMIYWAFVFGRVLKVKAEITKTKLAIQAQADKNK
jgi:hypothetical protein